VRSLALFCELSMLLPITLAQPFVGVLLWSWISFMNPHRMVYGGIALAVPWALLTFIATMVGCLVAREPKRFPFNAVTVLIILFLLMISLSTCFAMAPWPEVSHKHSEVFKTFLFLLVTAALLTSRERIHALIWVMAMSLAFFGIKGGGFTPMLGGAQKVLGPPNSMINDNNHLAAALLVSLPLMNYLRMESKHYIIRLGFAAVWCSPYSRLLAAIRVVHSLAWEPSAFSVAQDSQQAALRRGHTWRRCPRGSIHAGQLGRANALDPELSAGRLCHRTPEHMVRGLDHGEVTYFWLGILWALHAIRSRSFRFECPSSCGAQHLVWGFG
jgi:hypothetical protein